MTRARFSQLLLGLTMVVVMVLAASDALAAEAGELRVGALLGSLHLTSPPSGLDEWEEDNRGVEVEYQLTGRVHLAAGWYEPNSVGAESAFAGAGLELGRHGRWDGGAEVGAASGYGEYYRDVLPIIVIYGNARFDDRHVIKLRYGAIVLAASYQYAF